MSSDGKFLHQPRVSRIEDLSAIPSPFLNGIFDRLLDSGLTEQWLGLWETNRGCPFGCAFCEWGADTFNKVYQFDIERLRKEMQWFARNNIEFIFCCDANFGLLERDVEIAEYMGRMKEEYGHPHVFSVQSSKNATDRIYKIQKMLNDSNLSKGVLLALQSVNKSTLEKVHRANISMDTFDELQRRFKRDGIKTFTDLILGLPGETYDTFVDGVSKVIDGGQHDRIQFINLSILGNARMADPEYQKEYGFKTVRSRIVNIHGSLEGAGDDIEEMQDLVVATSDMPERDWIRARVFSWFAALLHFNKLLQIPMIVLHEKYGLSYRAIVESFAESSACPGPALTGLREFFELKAADIQNGGPEFCRDEKWLNIWWPPDEYMMVKLCAENMLDVFYNEAEMLFFQVLKDGNIDGGELLSDCIRLNRALIKLPQQDTDISLPVSHNIWEYYGSILCGLPLDLKREQCEYRIDRTSESWNSWEDWCRRVIWWGNKKGAYLYGVVAQ
jgi:hypothetical protein